MSSCFRELALVMLAAVTAACSPSPGQDDGLEPAECAWVESAVSLDLKPGDKPELTLSPRTLLEVLEQEQRGELDWLGGGEWVDLVPSEGTGRHLCCQRVWSPVVVSM